MARSMLQPIIAGVIVFWFDGALGSGVEFAVVGHAMPILLHVEPIRGMAKTAQRQVAESIDDNMVYDFGTCCVGRKVDVAFLLVNHSELLPLHVQPRRLPHFTCKPSCAVLPSKSKSEVLISFCPKQLGVFNVSLVLEVVDATGHSGKKPVIFELYLNLRGTGVSDDKKKIKPFVGTLLSKEWNLSTNTAEQFGSAHETQPDAKMRSHHSLNSRVAHPNETKLARSIRPHPPEDRAK